VPRERVQADRYQLRRPAPRPLERNRIVLAEDGQILIDKSRKFQYELGQWIDPDAFLQI
jgi:cytochrome b6-f complex iron-sulfur subunit